jgi:outer membrane protein assembly factor BamB
MLFLVPTLSGEENVNDQNQRIVLNCLYVASFVAVIFIATLTVMLMTHHLRLSAVAPLEFTELENMKDAARTDVTNLELRARIRQLDLISRRAWFLGLEWRRSAVHLLAFGVVLLFVSMSLIMAIKPRELSADACRPPGSSPGAEVVGLMILAGVCVLGVNGFLLVAGVGPAPAPAPVPAPAPSSTPASASASAPAPAPASAEGKTATGVATASLATGTPATGIVIATPASAAPAVPGLVIAAPASAAPAVPGLVDAAPVDPATIEQNWTSFRGPRNNGRSAVQQPVIGWSANSGAGIKWKVKTPISGFSSPIIWKDRLFLTGGDDTTRAIFCYAADSGALLWTHEASGIAGSPAKPPKVTKDTGYAASTPTTNGRLVFAVFAVGDLVAVDLEGRRVWARNLGVPENMYGFCSSLLVADDRLIVQYDNEDRQVLLCFQASTGTLLWQQQRRSIISWSSPLLCRAGDKEMVIILTCKEVEAYDLETGEKKWTQPIMGGEVAPSATANDAGIVFVANENAVVAAIQATDGSLLWKNGNAILPDVSSPVVYKDMVFLFSSAATIGCLDAASGELLWEKDVKEGFYSSPLALQDRITAFDKKGNFLVIQPDRGDLRIEHQESLGESVLTTPAVVGNRMWVRGVTHLYCLESAGAKHGRE